MKHPKHVGSVVKSRVGGFKRLTIKSCQEPQEAVRALRIYLKAYMNTQLKGKGHLACTPPQSPVSLRGCDWKRWGQLSLSKNFWLQLVWLLNLGIRNTLYFCSGGCSKERPILFVGHVNADLLNMCLSTWLFIPGKVLNLAILGFVTNMVLCTELRTVAVSNIAVIQRRL